MFTSSERWDMDYVMIHKLPPLHKHVRHIYSWIVFVCNDNIPDDTNIGKLFSRFPDFWIPYTYQTQTPKIMCLKKSLDRLLSNLPSPYSGVAKRSSGVNALPQEGCCKLLQVPSKVRYFVITHTGSRGHVSSNKLNLVSIVCNPSPACSGESSNL